MAEILGGRSHRQKKMLCFVEKNDYTKEGSQMKNQWLLVFLSFVCIACSQPADPYPDTPKVEYDYSFTNNTSFNLTISPMSSGDFQTFSLSSSQTKVIKSTSSVLYFLTNGSTGSYIIDYERDGRSISLYQYLYRVEYEISGTASSVNVTLNNSTGGTEQYSTVLLPKKYSYTTFSDSFLYISAQNNGSSGSVTVKIFLYGKLFKTSTSSGAYVIATASGSK